MGGLIGTIVVFFVIRLIYAAIKAAIASSNNNSTEVNNAKNYQREYSNAISDYKKSMGLIVQFGVFTAMSDGTMDQSEATVIKGWIQKTVSSIIQDHSADIKLILNLAFKNAFEKARVGELNFTNLISELNEVGNSTFKSQALELAFAVLSADGNIENSELKVIDNLVRGLGLDSKEVSRIRDQQLILLNISTSTSSTTESILGIQPGWDKEATRKHLQLEFQKWNGRLSTLAEGEGRKNAQKMLDIIGTLRQKYD